jgi:hypothetical protein
VANGANAGSDMNQRLNPRNVDALNEIPIETTLVRDRFPFDVHDRPCGDILQLDALSVIDRRAVYVAQHGLV